MLLVIEKDPRFVAKMKQRLKPAGLRCFFVASVQDALFLMKSMPAKFILANLSAIENWEELAELRRFAADRGAPALFIEGHVQAKTLAERLRGAGETALVKLPLTISQLAQRIEALRADRDPLVGAVIGPPGQEVSVLRKLDAGSMGAVYEGRQPSLDRRVAVKVLSKQWLSADPGSSARFRVEAKAMAAMRSPHVAQVFSVGEHGGRAYIVMEFIDGDTLEKRLRRKKRLKAGEALALARQILLGLAEAHRRGKIHRDLKPANVMINRDGQAVILDFGLVRDASSQRMTQAGAMMGTPRYISPEQVSGGEAGPHSDLYALGVMLFEMLVGEPPFQADDMVGVLMKHVKEPFPRPEDFGRSLPQSLVEIVEKLTRKQPADRYASAQAALRDIDAFLAAMSDDSARALDAGSSAVMTVEPAGGVAVDSQGAVARRFGVLPADRPRALHALHRLANQLRTMDQGLGAFERGSAILGGGALAFFSTRNGLAGLEVPAAEAETYGERVALDQVAKLFSREGGS